ncbi:MAG: tRNA-dihydrouridine synthase, partial [Pseudomonadota bacterium]
MFQAQWPFTIPSGVVTTAPSVMSRIAREIDEIGFLTTKTLSLEPRTGYLEPIISEYHHGCFINAVGLPSPGAEWFASAMKPLLPLYKSKPLLVSIMGSDPDEFLKCAKILFDVADAFELNLSCPHVKAAGQSVGSDPDMVDRIIRLLCKNLRKPIIPKLSPNLSNVVEIAIICEKAGASALSLINTVGPGMAVDDMGNPILSNVVGGISGSAIKPIGLRIVREVAQQVRLPIIASGGIDSPVDVEAYRKAGASFFAVGSALAGASTEETKIFFRTIGKSYRSKRIETTNIRVKTRNDSLLMTAYSKTRVVSNRQVSSNIFRLELESGSVCQPGQFFFLRIPNSGEKPFSPMNDLKPVYLIRSIGPFTQRLSVLKTGDTVYVRGPYGNGFKAPNSGEKLILVGGGTGAAPIIMAASKWSSRVWRTYFGFSSNFEERFERQIGSLKPSPAILIDSPGLVGAVVDFVDGEMTALGELPENMSVYLCGPREMMKRIGAVFARFTTHDRIYVAREDIM